MLKILLLSCSLLISFVSAMMKIIYKHAQKRHTKVEGKDEGVLNKIILFCEHYIGIPLYFIANSYLLLDFFSVGFLYIILQNLIS